MQRTFTIISVILLNFYLFPQEYFFKKYNSASGLIQNTIRVIHQDNLGRLWIATAEGLNIYDGEEFINCNYMTEPDNNIITCFYELSNSIMLAGTNGRGIIAFLKTPFGADTLLKTFSGKEYLISNNINKILKDWENNYWICTDSGITKWSLQDISSGKIEVRHYGKDEGIPGRYINGTIDSDNRIIWFSSDAGLIKSDGKKFSHVTDAFQESIYSIYAEGDSLLLAASNKILIYKDGEIKSFYELPTNYTISKILKDSKGIFWFSTTEGLLKYDGKNFTLVTRNNGLEENFIISLMEDREGNIWVGSINGLFKYSPDSFYFLTGSETLPHIQNLRMDKNAVPWISTTGGLYTIENNRLVYSKLNNNFKKIRITDIVFTDENEALVSTIKGIFQIENYGNGNASIIKVFGEKEFSHLIPDYPYTSTCKICVDKEKNIWIQNKDGKIFIISGGIMKPLDTRDFRFGNGIIFPKDLATNFFNDSKNNIWLGYFNQGLFKISKDSITKFTIEHGLKDSHIRSIFEDSKGNIWIGTRYSGVFKYSEEKPAYRTGRFIQYSTENGLNSNWVMTITEDKFGNLWFGTGKGVMKYDGEIWKTYDETKGIKAGEMSFSATGADGTVYISSLSGIYFHHPDPEPKVVLPIVLIKKFQFIDGSNINYDKKSILNTDIIFNSKANQSSGYSEPEFDYNQNSFTFEFASTSLKNEEKTLYTYKLKGFDEGWSQLAKHNFVNYVNLPAGSYKFLVKAKNSDGLWTENPAEVTFVITPPLWETWWFRFFALVFIISAVAVITTIINRYRMAQALKIEKMRTKIATDLHDDIGTSLSSIAIFSQLAKRKKTVSEDYLNEYLEKIERTSINLIDAMGDIVWSINPQNDSFEDAILKMEDFAVKLLEAKGIDVQITISKEIEDINLPLELRRNLLLIFKEMITNTAKHSNADKVIINISTENGIQRGKKIFIKVEDNGVGFNPDVNYKGNGLKNLKARSESVGGNILITSEKGKGTDYLFQLPLKN